MRLFWNRSGEHADAAAEQSPYATAIAACPAGQEAEVRNAIPDVESARLEPGTTGASEHEPFDVEALAEQLTDRRSRVKRGALYWMWMALSPILCVWMIISVSAGDLRWVPLCIAGLATSRLLSLQASRQERERAALQNSHLDMRWIGAMADALEWPDRRVQASAALLLTQFLPRLKPHGAEWVSEENRACLYRRLTPAATRSDPNLVLAILRSLPLIGSDAALPYVQRLARRFVITPDGRRVRDAARATLASLERRVAEQRAQNQLAPKNDGLNCGSELDTSITTSSTEPVRSDREQAELDGINSLVDKQLEEFEAELRKIKSPGMRLGFLIASWCVMVPYFAVQTGLQFAGKNWLGGVVFAVLTLFSTQLFRLTLNQQHQVLARKLARLDDVRCIGRLAEALEWPDATIRRIVMAALARLLPRVKATDNVLQTPLQRGNLNHMLVLGKADRYSDLLVGILQALQQVGDASSIPYVELLARATPTSSRQRTVCDAARDCLEYLKVRAELNRSSQTLLRPSFANTAGADTLVRPAAANDITDAEQLLRPDSGSASG